MSEPGWYRDPVDPASLRWFDGAAFSNFQRPVGADLSATLTTLPTASVRVVNIPPQPQSPQSATALHAQAAASKVWIAVAAAVVTVLLGGGVGLAAAAAPAGSDSIEASPASAQRKAEGSSAAPTTVAPTTAPVTTAPPQTEPPPAPPAPKAGDSFGKLSEPGRSIADAKRVHDQEYGPNYRQDSAYQCVAWARARWIELGAPKPAFNDGWLLAADNGGVVGGDPTLGAMASMGSSEPGHVAIVEEIDRSNGQLRIRISEMNNGDTNDIGIPEEFRDNHWMVRNSDNTWTYDDLGNQGVLTFAALPK